jgi:ubiquinone/menaquinone biosynthesis C-methylase UbiE
MSEMLSPQPRDNDLARVAGMISGGALLDPARVIDNLNIMPDMKVADFGCGTGHFTILIAKRVGEDGRVSAIDVQEAPLESVKTRAREAGLANIDPIRANLEVLGSTRLNDGSQDIVFVANVLFQSNKKDLIIREAYRILKAGGQLVMVEWKKGGGGFGPPDNLRMDGDQLKKLVTGEGLTFERDVEVGQYHHVMMFTK